MRNAGSLWKVRRGYIKCSMPFLQDDTLGTILQALRKGALNCLLLLSEKHPLPLTFLQKNSYNGDASWFSSSACSLTGTCTIPSTGGPCMSLHVILPFVGQLADLGSSRTQPTPMRLKTTRLLAPNSARPRRHTTRLPGVMAQAIGLKPTLRRKHSSLA